MRYCVLAGFCSRSDPATESWFGLYLRLLSFLIVHISDSKEGLCLSIAPIDIAHLPYNVSGYYCSRSITETVNFNKHARSALFTYIMSKLGNASAATKSLDAYCIVRFQLVVARMITSSVLHRPPSSRTRDIPYQTTMQHYVREYFYVMRYRIHEHAGTVCHKYVVSTHEVSAPSGGNM
jgi:hypothetical protein